MWALKVTRSTIAATRRGSGNTVPHSLKGRFVAIATEAFSSRSVMISEQQLRAPGIDADIAKLVKAEQLQAGVAGHHSRQLPGVGGFDELVDQVRGGHVTHPASLLTGRQPETDQQMRLAGAGVTEQHHRVTSLEVGAAG